MKCIELFRETHTGQSANDYKYTCPIEYDYIRSCPQNNGEDITCNDCWETMDVDTTDKDLVLKDEWGNIVYRAVGRSESRWIYDGQGNCFCENCKIRPAPIIPTRYCPNCGARMTNQGELHHKETESTNGVLK